MSEQEVNLTIRVTGKEYGEFEIPYPTNFDTEDREDWYREVYTGSLEPARFRLDALGFSDPDAEGDRAALVSIVDEEGNVYWEYELHSTGAYSSLSHVTIPQEVTHDPNLAPKRVRNA